MLADDAVPPQQSASMTIGPLGQREMKGLVPIAVVVEKRDDALRFPRFRVRSPAGLVGWGQHVGLSDAFPESAICGKRIHHVSDNWVFETVSHEQDRESSKQITDEATCPSFGQVRRSKIGASQHERSTLWILVADQPVQVDDAVPDPALRHRKPRS